MNKITMESGIKIDPKSNRNTKRAKAIINIHKNSGINIIQQYSISPL